MTSDLFPRLLIESRNIGHHQRNEIQLLSFLLVQHYRMMGFRDVLIITNDFSFVSASSYSIKEHRASSEYRNSTFEFSASPALQDDGI